MKVQHKSKAILSPDLMISLLTVVGIFHAYIYDFEILHHEDQAEIDEIGPLSKCAFGQPRLAYQSPDPHIRTPYSGL